MLREVKEVQQFRQIALQLADHPRIPRAPARALPDGSWALFAGLSSPLQVFLVKLPPTPRPDEYDRSNFVNVPVNLPDCPAATIAQVDYGYEENALRTNYYCTQRPETCSIPATPEMTV